MYCTVLYFTVLYCTVLYCYCDGNFLVHHMNPLRIEICVGNQFAGAVFICPNIRLLSSIVYCHLDVIDHRCHLIFRCKCQINHCCHPLSAVYLLYNSNQSLVPSIVFCCTFKINHCCHPLFSVVHLKSIIVVIHCFLLYNLKSIIAVIHCFMLYI